ncbi:MAG TPA: hypothetical protein VGS58_19955, partial [Candidatus Sulfopaludibacter sp.]|nr:hypothetical protein [Candidatus Sulfopaludibacter sp.]
ATSALYLKIKTDGGPEGFYGPIDKGVAFVVDEQLRPFLIGKDALAQEKPAEYLILKMRSYYHFEKNPPLLQKAHFALPDKPGFGIELDDAKVESREQMRWS